MKSVLRPALALWLLALSVLSVNHCGLSQAQDKIAPIQAVAVPKTPEQPASKAAGATKEPAPNTAQLQPPPIVWQKPEGELPRWLAAPEEHSLSEKIEEGIRDRLEQRIDVSFHEAPLSEVLKYFSKELDINIIVDEKAFEDENISTEEPVTLELSNVKCRSAIKLIFEPLQLIYQIREEVVVVTTRKSSSNVVRYYDLSYLFPDDSLGGELVSLIEQAVAPDTWQSAGGTGNLRVFGSMLVVSAADPEHEAVAELLRKVSKQSKSNMKPARPKLKGKS